MMIRLNVKMFVMTKQKLTDSVYYQNAGPAVSFLCVFTHAFDRIFVMSEYVTDY